MAYPIQTPDPFNLIITGVGGQGNVLASRVVGTMLIEKGLTVTIGETFGASQRGGSVMSHLRISTRPGLSPQIPRGGAHMVVALEPTEALRVLPDYGNPKVDVLCNVRPIHGIGVISGDLVYPSPADLEKWIGSLSAKAWFINATDAAAAMGHPILGNVMMVGAMAATRRLPLDRSSFAAVIARLMPAGKVAVNMAAFDQGGEMIGNCR